MNGYLSCPDPQCDERFYDRHDEHRIAGLVYHLKRDHPVILRNLQRKLGVEIGETEGVEA